MVFDIFLSPQTSQRRNDMKQFSVPAFMVAYGLCATIVLWFLPIGGALPVAGIFGLISVMVLAVAGDIANRYDSLVVPEMFFNPVVFALLRVLNLILALTALFLFMHQSDAAILRVPFNVFSAMVILSTVPLCVAVLKLTPKPWTMVIGPGDLYYLHGNILPQKISSYDAKIITAETKVPVSVRCGVYDVEQSFCFASWVFLEENRQLLPGHMYYSSIVKKAERELVAAFEKAHVFTTEEVLVFIHDRAIQPPHSTSPYIWNNDTSVSRPGTFRR